MVYWAIDPVSVIYYLSANSFKTISASEWIVVLCRLSPTVPEKILKLSSSAVVSKTFSSTISISRSLNIHTFVALSLIIHITNSMANLLILGVLIGGYWCFFRIWTNLLANPASVIPALSNMILASSEVMNLKTCAASPTITSCSLFSSDMIAWSTCNRRGRG